ncbi:TetR family transcriptional regulator [Umezawaea endophytica]|uniref:TetR family transcriptional regulator n=1 Tax=Umezawaea endophytica TaxID=1654476 RepID=A0A9X2VPW2_9PSEU|nr:TetR family transcriptional regulator [Umezawaea endophytica]MCS7480663.1 TetR family transcriptional regulator [Umezawaea endophytica]
MPEIRRRSAPATRAAILDAARVRFGADGFDRVTIRDIAGDVGVDPAMVIRYFGSKDALFAEASAFDMELPDLTGLAPEAVADVLMVRFFDVWEDNAGFLSLMRAAATSKVAADKMLELFSRQVAPVLGSAAVDRPADRAALVGSQILGLALSRYVLRVPPLVAMSQEELRTLIGPVITHYLTGKVFE